MFEAPGLTLDDVVVPLRVVERPDQLDESLLASMRVELLTALDALGDRVSSERRAKIQHEVNSLSIDPRPFFDMHGPNLSKSPGTAFLVTPVREEMDTALATPDGREDVTLSSFQRFLSGFTNTMTGHRDGIELGARFMVHDGRTVRDLIGSTQFWQPDDFESTDHMIEGEFDERGAFHGFAVGVREISACLPRIAVSLAVLTGSG